MSTLEVKVPDIGDFKEVEVIELLIKPGDVVSADQSLITVESDKASMEIPSSHAGVVKELKVKLGDKVKEGSLLLVLETEGAAAPAQGAQASAAASAPATAQAASAPAPAPAAAQAAPVPAAAQAAPAPALSLVESPRPAPSGEEAGGKPHASPSIRKFARELGIDLVRINGSGPKGRITHEDVQNYVKSVIAGSAVPTGVPSAVPSAKGGGAGLDLLPWPSLDFSKFGPT
jgi:pyruvate dehydrogenase E2 component (dihydrolipoamide acetyltransferase)